VEFYYIYYVLDDSATGVNKKISSQLNELTKIGIIAQRITVKKSFYFNDENDVSRFQRIINIFTIIKNQYDMAKAVKQVNSLLGQKGILYFRYPCPYNYYISIFLKKSEYCKIVTEHNTIEVLEYKLLHNFILLFLELVFGKIARNFSDGIVGVTDEITEYQLGRIGHDRMPHITIGNGITVAAIKIRNPPNFLGNRLDLLCVAHVMPWHGFDRVIESMASFHGNKEIVFHIVGDGAGIILLKKLANRYNLDKKVIFYGYLSGKALDDLFDQCHIAVGSLGIHRKGLSQTSELKLREYCARGIPSIYSASEPDFPNNFPYFLKVPEDDGPLDLEEIFGFTSKIYLDKNHNIKMRKYATENLDWNIKIKKLRDFCESI